MTNGPHDLVRAYGRALAKSKLESHIAAAENDASLYHKNSIHRLNYLRRRDALLLREMQNTLEQSDPRGTQQNGVAVFPALVRSTGKNQ